MFIKTIRIKNYRSFKDSGEIPFNNYTIFLGTNGSGKSNILKAIKTFYDTNVNVNVEDFYNRNTNEDISIIVTFHKLNHDEINHFQSFIQNDLLVVEKIFSYSGNPKGLYYGQSKQNPDFAPIKNLGAAEKRKKYKELKDEKPELYNDLPTVKNGAEVDEAFKKWEIENSDKLEWKKAEVQFIGARNIGGGSLDNYTRFILVPAVREAINEASDARGGALGELMNILVKEVVLQKEEIVKLQKSTTEEFKRLTSIENLPEIPNLEDRLTDRLREFVPGSAVHLTLGDVDEPFFNFPKAEVELTEDKFRGLIESKGHGLQRSFIIAIIQELAIVQAQRNEQLRRDSDKQENDETVETERIAKDFMPDLILAIEEPELYQHPIRQRHFSRVINDFTTLNDRRVRIQAVICTHSPYFVTLKKFNDMRLVVKNSDEQGLINSRVNLGDGNKACNIYCSAKNITTPKTDVFINGLNNINDVNVNEAFFAQNVIIVEGADDKAVIEAFLKKNNLDCIKYGIPIIDAEGKSNISKIYAVLSSFNINTFTIFDCDGHETDMSKKEKHKEQNKILFNLFNYDNKEDFPSSALIENEFACYPFNLEKQIINDIPSYNFEDRRNAISGQKLLNCKSPVVYEEILKEIEEHKLTCKTLDLIVEKIKTKFGIE